VQRPQEEEEKKKKKRSVSLPKQKFLVLISKLKN